MDTVNWLLINGGNALTGAWDWVVYALGGLCHVLGAALNPILSPALAAVNTPCTWLGDCVYALLSPLPVWLGLTILSVLTGVVMLIVLRYVSNQDAISRAKDDIKANLLALKLFKDDLGVTMRTQLRLLWAILRLQRYILTPVLVMLIPMVLALAQMGIRYQWRPLQPGEQTTVEMKLAENAGALTNVQLDAGVAAVVEVGPVPGDGLLVWRIRGGEPGRHTLRFSFDDTASGATGFIEKELVIGPGLQRVSAIRVASDWTTQLLHPAEPRIDRASPAQSIEILYPGVDSIIYGADWWILHFFVVSMIAALLLKPIFKVRF